MIKKLTFINRKFAVLRYNSLKSRNEFLQKYCWCNISWKLAGVALGALLFEFHLHNNKLFATSKSLDSFHNNLFYYLGHYPFSFDYWILRW